MLFTQTQWFDWNMKGTKMIHFSFQLISSVLVEPIEAPAAVLCHWFTIDHGQGSQDYGGMGEFWWSQSWHCHATFGRGIIDGVFANPSRKARLWWEMVNHTLKGDQLGSWIALVEHPRFFWRFVFNLLVGICTFLDSYHFGCMMSSPNDPEPIFSHLLPTVLEAFHSLPFTYWFNTSKSITLLLFTDVYSLHTV